MDRGRRRRYDQRVGPNNPRRCNEPQFIPLGCVGGTPWGSAAQHRNFGNTGVRVNVDFITDGWKNSA